MFTSLSWRGFFWKDVEAKQNFEGNDGRCGEKR